MLAPLIVVAGTGTGVGKSHAAATLLLAWGRRARVVGYKPVETGVAAEPGEDATRLRLASTFHVKPSPRSETFTAPISPHLAARREGRTVGVEELLHETARLRQAADGVVLELAGGLFSPLDIGVMNADFVLQLGVCATILVAPDRLGVLHDLAATTRAAAAADIPLVGIVFSAPAEPDASTGTNAAEAHAVTHLPVLASLPRAHESTLAGRDDVASLLAACLRPPA